ncbi:MAG: diacylglycerol/lipid kinase family protein [Lachnospiraceae bacterium]
MKKLLFVFNPKSGKAMIRLYLMDIIDIFNREGYAVTVCTTQYSGHATEIVRAMAKEYDLLVCSGGDGTLNEVINGIMGIENAPIVGYIPSGSTNDFGNSLGLSKNMLHSAEIAIKGCPFACDLGLFNERYFSYVAAFGAFTAVTYMTPQFTKNVLGHQAYIWEAVKTLNSIKPIPMKVEYVVEEDDEERHVTIEDEFLYGMVSNSEQVAGIKGLAGRNVNMQDGLFEGLFVAKPKNALELPTTITAIFMKMPDKYIYSFKSAQIHITTSEAIGWTLDGEFGGEVTEVDIQNCKQALRIQVPTEKELENLDMMSE